MTLLTLDRLNAATPTGFVALLEGVYEHSPWVAEAALPLRPFRTLAHLKHALAAPSRPRRPTSN